MAGYLTVTCSLASLKPVVQKQASRCSKHSQQHPSRACVQAQNKLNITEPFGFRC